MKTFTISAHKFYSPDFRNWLRKWWLEKALVSDIQPKQFGEFEISIGFENSDPDEVRECLNDISWRELPDYVMRGSYV